MRKAADFKLVYDTGQKIFSPSCVLFYLASPAVKAWGVVAGKKVGNAVKRHRAKRLIRETVRLLQKDYRFADGRLVIIARQSITTLKQTAVHRVLEELLKNEQLIFSREADNSEQIAGFID